MKTHHFFIGALIVSVCHAGGDNDSLLAQETELVTRPYGDRGQGSGHKPDQKGRGVNPFEPREPLFLRACRDGNAEAIAYYLTCLDHVVDLHIKDSEGNTPLHFVAQQGLSDAVQAFIEIDPSLVTMPNNKGYFPLYYAVKNRHEEVALLLMECSEFVDVTGRTILHYVAIHGDVDTARALIEDDSSPLLAVDQQNRTPFYYALLHRHKPVLELFLAHGVDVDSAMFYESTDLMVYNAQVTMCNAVSYYEYAQSKGWNDILELLTPYHKAGFFERIRRKLPFGRKNSDS